MRGARCVDVGREVVAPALFAGLDQDAAARMADALLVEQPERQQRGEGGIAVVGAAAAIESTVAKHRLPGPEVRVPAHHLGLFVEVSVEENRVVALPRARVLHPENGRPSGELHHFDRELRERLCLAPLAGQRHRAVQFALRLPVGLEGGRLGGNCDVLPQRRENARLPGRFDGVSCGRGVHPLMLRRRSTDGK